jgi:hypothetical protein
MVAQQLCRVAGNNNSAVEDPCLFFHLTTVVVGLLVALICEGWRSADVMKHGMDISNLRPAPHEQHGGVFISEPNTVNHSHLTCECIASTWTGTAPATLEIPTVSTDLALEADHAPRRLVCCHGDVFEILPAS